MSVIDEYMRMFEIARQCIDIIKKHVSPDEADYLETYLDVGEPDLAVEGALDLVYDKRELLQYFPDSVKQLTQNADYPEIQVFADYFE